VGLVDAAKSGWTRLYAATSSRHAQDQAPGAAASCGRSFQREGAQEGLPIRLQGTFTVAVALRPRWSGRRAAIEGIRRHLPAPPPEALPDQPRIWPGLEQAVRSYWDALVWEGSATAASIVGLTMSSYGRSHRDSRGSRAAVRDRKPVESGELREGDLVFFDTSATACRTSDDVDLPNRRSSTPDRRTEWSRRRSTIDGSSRAISARAGGALRKALPRRRAAGARRSRALLRVPFGTGSGFRASPSTQGGAGVAGLWPLRARRRQARIALVLIQSWRLSGKRRRKTRASRCTRGHRAGVEGLRALGVIDTLLVPAAWRRRCCAGRGCRR